MVLATGHQVRCIHWVQVAIFNKGIGFLSGIKSLHWIYFVKNTYNQVYGWCFKYPKILTVKDIAIDNHELPQLAKMYLKNVLRPVFKTRHQDAHADLKTLTDSSFCRRIFKVLKTSILDVLQPKFNAPFKTSFHVAITTTTEASSKRWYNG